MTSGSSKGFASAVFRLANNGIRSGEFQHRADRRAVSCPAVRGSGQLESRVDRPAQRVVRSSPSGQQRVPCRNKQGGAKRQPAARRSPDLVLHGHQLLVGVTQAHSEDLGERFHQMAGKPLMLLLESFELLARQYVEFGVFQRRRIVEACHF